ncbi:MAG: FAD-dependent oxidoreductase, partial [Candidatus Gastranaerophilales bacterium]|nr:FAD-dependent oxidoreductase [Candidatus Gastranaerophilales bacterium]
MSNVDTDIIIVGGGPAGMAAAITSAKSGLKTVLLERGDFCGSKNMFGGAIYTIPTLEIYPNFLDEAPLERGISRHTYALLGKKDGTLVSYDNPTEPDDKYLAYSVLRPKWDRWCASEAEKAGAYIVPQTLVEELLFENGKCCGIKTANEEYRSKIVILADGVNSLLAKKHNLRKDIKATNVALSVKQTISLPKEKIEDRFNLNEDNGTVYTIMGGPMLGITAMGFVYTNKESVSIGLGVTLEDLKNSNKTPYEFLEELKEHPSIKPLIKDGEVKEYSAHLIPEGGYKAVPKLYFDGLMIAGDAGSLVNNVHWEGTNLSMLSGKYAALTAIEAIKNNDLTSKTLKNYEKRLKESFILKDMYSYRNIMGTIESNAKAFLGFYPEKINESMREFTETDNIPKKE